MAHLGNDAAIQSSDRLLRQYGFDLAGQTVESILDSWLRQFPSRWIRLALIEALYQGRYKAFSVEHILDQWLRREQPTYHFNSEFEALICNNMPRNLCQVEPESHHPPRHRPKEKESEQITPPSSDLTHVTDLGEGITSSIRQFHPDPPASEFTSKLTEIVRRWRSQGDMETRLPQR
ncbi:hypothetical protein L3556_08455 [Candidatus Synechococcus calcipolaris G9]|uniref:DnaD domain-containing protein n=1 Tax=Candidatus Synechococcus calcipolaris G9 TaxID=1497997 RepID=A0ABT6EZB2_9SYNE|nr:hypothetical protein [Candidatus Synechococcus calcipolaris]MDG2990956.1 hypothetical protein [Candidatus Synechococcus calcipolaris G9]